MTDYGEGIDDHAGIDPASSHTGQSGYWTSLGEPPMFSGKATDDVDDWLRHYKMNGEEKLGEAGGVEENANDSAVQVPRPQHGGKAMWFLPAAGDYLVSDDNIQQCDCNYSGIYDPDFHEYYDYDYNDYYDYYDYYDHDYYDNYDHHYTAINITTQLSEFVTDIGKSGSLKWAQEKLWSNNVYHWGVMNIYHVLLVQDPDIVEKSLEALKEAAQFSQPSPVKRVASYTFLGVFGHSFVNACETIGLYSKSLFSPDMIVVLGHLSFQENKFKGFSYYCFMLAPNQIALAQWIAYGKEAKLRMASLPDRQHLTGTGRLLPELHTFELCHHH
ncbi:uncharacterized protein LOC125945718 [Dermacentor silvarum]|uniref:uncharacterized protein LOC125945718 n=1 Tax=Dermacentor silvarum TaxID=543639 RepID=UPI002100F181|nr:uncharacterized protein LOC125945718 [Dermacentor silvarum]